LLQHIINKALFHLKVILIARHNLNGENIEFPNEHEYGFQFPIESINRIFGWHGHQFVYDYETFKFHLNKAGFQSVKKRSFREGTIPELLGDQEFRKAESMYIEDIK